MESVSSIAVAVVFLSGASIGALATALYRYAVGERIRRDFELSLAAIADLRVPEELPQPAVSTGRAVAAQRDSSQVDVEQAEDQDATNWIPSQGSTHNPVVQRLP
jgi:hypothetical protein